MMRYHWNVLPLDQRKPFVLGSPVTVVSQPAFSGKVPTVMRALRLPKTVVQRQSH